MKKKILFLFLMACFLIISNACGNSIKPVILISHPTKVFLSGYFNLVEKKMLPQSELILLFHEKQKKRIRAVRKFMKKNKYNAYSIVTLKGYPKVTVNRAIAEKFKYNIIENYDLFFNQSRKPYLPPAWRKKFKELIDKTDAYFIPGGSNVPARYHRQGQFVEAISTTPIRTLYEYAFLRYLLNSKDEYLKKKPGYLLVGYCYGHQLLNVALDGDLYQSIPIEVYGQNYIRDIIKSQPDNIHRNFFLAHNPPLTRTYNGWFHKIKILAQTNYFTETNNIYMLSNHQQAIKKLGKNLKIIATSIDGKIPEVVQHVTYKNVIGLQGHLERQFGLDQLHKFPESTRKFHYQFWEEINKVLIANMEQRTKHKHN